MNVKDFAEKSLDELIKHDKRKDARTGPKKKLNKRIDKRENTRQRGRRVPNNFRRSNRKEFRPVRRVRYEHYERRAPPRQSWEKRPPQNLRRGMEERRVLEPEMPVKKRNTKLFVNNLPMKITNEELNELFSNIGYLTKCKLVFDDFGKSKGRAVVNYESEKDAARAIEKIDGNDLDGKIISVEFAPEKRKERGQRDYYNGHDSRIEGRGRPVRGERGKERYARY